MGRTVAYLRVSTQKQDLDNQELEIRRYASKEGLVVDEFVKVAVSSKESTADRRIDELLDLLKSGDVLVVSELSRLGRSLGQVVNIVDALIGAHVDLHVIKENIRVEGRPDLATRVLVGIFGVLAEVERELIVLRTKAGLEKARASGKTLGRPKGSLGKSKLDGKEEVLEDLVKKGVTRLNIARILGCSWHTVDSFCRKRGIATWA